MTVEPIRCMAPHPANPLRPCRGILTRAVIGTVEASRGTDPPPGCNEVRCERCGLRYVICPTAR